MRTVIQSKGELHPTAGGNPLADIHRPPGKGFLTYLKIIYSVLNSTVL